MQISINTAQNVKIDYELAGVGPRILATILDLLILGAFAFGITLFLGALSAFSRGSYILIGILIMLLPLYHLLCELFLHGKSIGKMALGLQVVRLDGKKVSFWNYLLRWIFRLIDITICSGVFAIISIASSRQMQRIGDLAAGTTVVRIQKRATLQQLSQYETTPDYTVSFPQVRLLSDKDINTIKEIVAEVNRTRQYELLTPLCTKVREITGITSNMDNLAFIETVLQDYTHLTKE